MNRAEKDIRESAMIVGAFTSIVLGLPQATFYRIEVADIIEGVVRQSRSANDEDLGFEESMLTIAAYLKDNTPRK